RAPTPVGCPFSHYVGMCRPVSRILSSSRWPVIEREATIYLGLSSPIASSSLPALFDGPPYTGLSQGLHESCLALHPVRFTWPPRSPGMPVGSYPTLSPIT